MKTPKVNVQTPIEQSKENQYNTPLYYLGAYDENILSQEEINYFENVDLMKHSVLVKIIAKPSVTESGLLIAGSSKKDLFSHAMVVKADNSDYVGNAGNKIPANPLNRGDVVYINDAMPINPINLKVLDKENTYVIVERHYIFARDRNYKNVKTFGDLFPQLKKVKKLQK